MTITKEFCKQLTREIAAAMETIAHNHHLTVENRGGAYDDTSFTPRIKFLVEDAGATLWNRWARMFDLPDDLVGKHVTHGRDRFRITALNPEAPKFPVVCVRESDGRPTRLTVEMVQVAYGKRRKEEAR